MKDKKGKVTLIGAIFWDFLFWEEKIRKDFPLFRGWLDKYIQYRDDLQNPLVINIKMLKKQDKEMGRTPCQNGHDRDRFGNYRGPENFIVRRECPFLK